MKESYSPLGSPRPPGGRSRSENVTDRRLEQLQPARIRDKYKVWVEYDEDNDVNIASAYNPEAQKR